MTATVSIGVGLIAGFVYTELTGVFGGGLIVPGYLALYMDQPVRIAATLLVALVAYAAVWAMSNVVILYGRRRFMACVLVGFWAGWALARAGIRMGPAGSELRSVGYIVPGLIANDMVRQGVVRTIASALVLAAAVRLVLIVAGQI